MTHPRPGAVSPRNWFTAALTPVLAVVVVALVVGAGAMPPAAAADAVTPGLAGDATPRLGAGTPGRVSVVASSAANENQVAVIVRNDTTGPVDHVRVSVTATSPERGSVTSAKTAAVVPATLAPGEYGLAAVEFRDHGVAPESSLAFKVTAKQAKSAGDPKLLAVSELARSVPQPGKIAQTLTFTVANPRKRAVKGPVTATVMCFNEAGVPVNLTHAKVRRAGLRAGRHARVEVGMKELCPAALIGARGA